MFTLLGGSFEQFTSPFAVFLSSSMGLMNIFLRKRRKIHPCLFFQRKTSNNPSTSQPDGKEVNKNNVAIIEEVRMAVFLAQGDLPRMSKKRKRDSPEELAVRKKSIEHTLRQRRNGICNEIERSLFQQGAYLEKHRHNLQVTLQLQERGLMWWCVETLVRFRFYSFGHYLNHRLLFKTRSFKIALRSSNTGNIFLQLVLRHCCSASWNSLLRVLPPAWPTCSATKHIVAN